MKVHADQDKCIGSGQCVHADVREAAEVCPSLAITVEE